MKTIIINLLMAIALFTVGTEIAYSQGCFTIDNGTLCSWDYIIYGNNANCNGTSVIVDQGTVAGTPVDINSTYCQSLSLVMERIEIYDGGNLVAAFGNKSVCGYPDTDSWNCSVCSCTVEETWDESNSEVIID